ncbi:MAG: TRAP transporter small permease subunit [Xanthomonadales bacterium]|nr:TRAP transporter small permease subunit [Xanthomonadales bacterium]NIN60035.1 TRAP transporter small permease subunit [Xanthomonadales bacterium]NIN75403.1 TRAP transporter small permease subunit [Xanthomonadales bacterium]NIO14226.1 TRAP transporter small permease subunit [Xanthomonadales bacterium]NIP12428.1 TRAP transporter small permease subunit [Xanthomonadales bacterium]
MRQLLAMLGWLDRASKALEDGFLVLLLGAMILLAGGQILLRNVFDVGFFWIDEALRLLVLWLAVAGAVAASRTDKHISINVLDRFLPPAALAWTKLAIHGFTAGMCGLIAWYSMVFVRDSIAFGDTLLGAVPAWIPQLILPVGFALIALRYAIFAARGAAGMWRQEGVA